MNEQHLSKRTLLQLSGGILASLAGCSSMLTHKNGNNDTMDKKSNSNGIVDQIYVRKTKEQLPKPAALPAVGLTNSGRYLQTVDSHGWVGPVPVGSKSQPVPELHTETASISGQTLVRLTMSKHQPYISAPELVPLKFDAILDDNLNEYDTDEFTFTPRETGRYFVSISALWQVHEDRDDLLLRFMNKTDDVSLLEDQRSSSGRMNHTTSVTSILELEQLKEYQVLGANLSHNDIIESYDPQTYCTIWRVPF